MSATIDRGGARRAASAPSRDNDKKEPRQIDWFTVSLYIIMFAVLAALAAAVVFLVI